MTKKHEVNKELAKDLENIAKQLSDVITNYQLVNVDNNLIHMGQYILKKAMAYQSGEIGDNKIKIEFYL